MVKDKWHQVAGADSTVALEQGVVKSGLLWAKSRRGSSWLRNLWAGGRDTPVAYLEERSKVLLLLRVRRCRTRTIPEKNEFMAQPALGDQKQRMPICHASLGVAPGYELC